MSANTAGRGGDGSEGDDIYTSEDILSMQHELQIMSGLDHPNVVGLGRDVWDLGVQGTRLEVNVKKVALCNLEL